MSAESVRKWEVFAEAMKAAPEAPEWPAIECTEDLVLAGRAVREAFCRSVQLLTTADGAGINAFDQRKYAQFVWFRGESHSNPEEPLCPQVFRDDFQLSRVDGWRSAEKWMITEFWRKAVLRSAHCPDPQRLLAWLALAQHHGLPTRLLDWSESINTAAWFATHDDPLARARSDLAGILDEAERVGSGLRDRLVASVEGGERGRIKRFLKPGPTVIWALSPALLNWHFSAPNNNGAFVFVNNDDPLLKYAYTGDISATPDVRAIWVQDVHPRMMSQNAYFTVHSTGKSLVNLNRQTPQSERFLIRLTVEPEASSGILKDLATAGVTLSTVYPDLSNLASDISARWKDIVSSIRSDLAGAPV